MSAKLLLLCAVCFSAVSGQRARFKVLYEWNYVNFTWPSEEVLRKALSLGQYIPENNIISGIKFYDGWYYLTLPRMKQGVPATLTRIPAESYMNDTEPLLEPYPNWDMNLEGDCKGLQNVQNVEIDRRGRIWILDGGRTATMSQLPNSKCRPRLVIYDIKNNVTVKDYTFPESITSNRSFLYDIVIDEVDGGYAYITDNSGPDPGIIVYSEKQEQSWKIRDDATMRASSDAIEFRVSGTALSAPINLAGIALGPRITHTSENHTFVSQDRYVYYCPLSSTHLYSILSSELRNQNNLNIFSKTKDLGRKSSQSDGMVMDENGVLYYGLLGDNSIAKWDSKTPFTSGQKIIARDTTYIQWPDSLAFDMSGNLLVVTNRLQKFIYGQMNLSEPNFRILEANIGAKSYIYGVPKEIPENKEISTMATSSINMQNNENGKTEEALADNITTPEPAITAANIEENLVSSSSEINLKKSLVIVLTLLSFIYSQ